jgi:hypothetical protein
MSLDHAQEVKGINKHATMPSSRQHIKTLSIALQNNVYCVCKGGILGA